MCAAHVGSPQSGQGHVAKAQARREEVNMSIFCGKRRPETHTAWIRYRHFISLVLRSKDSDSAWWPRREHAAARPRHVQALIAACVAGEAVGASYELCCGVFRLWFEVNEVSRISHSNPCDVH